MDTSTVQIHVDDTVEEIELPADVLSYLAEDSDSQASTVADLLIVDVTHRLHGAVHHAQGDADEEAAALESEMLEVFEARFGASFGELTGHDH